MQICGRCHQTKPTSAFYNKQSEHNGLSRWCGECHRVYQRAHRAGANERERLYQQQEGLCAICRQPETAVHVRGHYTRRVKRLSLDIGTNGEIRGLLCGRCNSALGLFEDDPVRIRRAVEYVLHLGVIQ